MAALENEIAKLRRWEDAYYNGKPLVPDATYDVERDRIVEQLKKIIPDHPYLDEVGAPTPSGGAWEKFTHTVVMGSLFKVNNEADLRKWARKKGNLFLLSEKADGCTITAYYEDGVLKTLATRGDGIIGEDITANARYLENVRLRLGNFTGILRGEGILYLDRFKEHFVPLGTANPRNGASGKVRDTKNPHLKRQITVKWFDIITDDVIFNTWEDKFKYLEDLGLDTIPYYSNLTLDKVWEIYQTYVANKRASLNYWIDGLVVRVLDLDMHDSFGTTDKRPKGSRAIKFPAIGEETTLDDSEINRGKGGRFTPVGLIDPVQIDGTTVGRVSMHGPDWVEQMDVAIGDTVLVAKAGDIIPQIIQVLHRPENRKPIVFPTHCPLCEIELVRHGAYIECQNKNCEGEILGSLAKWLDKTGIKGIGSSILCELTKEVKDIALLYEADATVFARAAKGSIKIGQKIYLAVQKTRSLPLAIFLSGLHINSLGTTNGQRIANHFKTLDAVLDASEDDFRKVEGISENATKIHQGLNRKLALIRKLQNLLDIDEVTEGLFTGLSFCITGKMSSGKKRPEVEVWIKSHGGISKSSISKDLTYLVTDTPNSGSSKNKKADKYGVKKITEDQLYTLVDNQSEPPKKIKVKKVTEKNAAIKNAAIKMHKLNIKQRKGLSLFDVFSKDNAGWIEVEENNGKFYIKNSNLIEIGDPSKCKTRLGFVAWDWDVIDVDNSSSPQAQQLSLSSHLKWNNVEFQESVVSASSLDELKEAFDKVTFTSWCEGDLK